MWHRYFPRFCGRFFLSAIRVRGAEKIPAAGPVLWLGLHRNGAVDGFGYAAALRRPLVFMISTQLRKSLLARVFFNGIAVARSNDEGDRAANKGALGECISLLQRGGELFVFPEGTSSLGPRHLPFKAGAAQLALDWLDAGNPAARLCVLPVGIHYESAWSFRSAVEVVIGEPIDLALPEGMAGLGRLRELKRRMSAALEAVGANFSDATAQREAEGLANATGMLGDFPRWGRLSEPAWVQGRFADGNSGRFGEAAPPRSRHSRFEILKACERGDCAAAIRDWRELDAAAMRVGARRYHGVPILPGGSGLGELVALVICGPIVLAGIALNAGPWFGACWAAKKFPDDTNVIALWKILAGLPLLAVWATAVVVALALTAGWRWVLAYVAVSALAWLMYDGVKRDAVAFGNRRFRPALSDPFRRVIAHWESAHDRDHSEPPAASA